MGGGASSDKDIFNKNGPSHLTSIDWTDLHYRTSVASSLVQGVYVLEKDRQKKRESLANPWWEFFHFSLLECLIDESDESIYGAIFKYNYYMDIPHSEESPRYVIAFRGTLIKLKTWLTDVVTDFQCVSHNLHRTPRFVHAIKAIKNHVAKHENEALWLAGHSLGAAIALLAGKTMMRIGVSLKAYIFNPPISSMPLEYLTDGNKRKFLFRISENIIRYCASEYFQINQDDSNTASWVPYIYVNKSDPICAEYIGYFKHKIFMIAIGLGKIENDDFSGGTSSDSSPIHLLSSADLTDNTNKMTDWRIAHRLKQWWEPDLALRAKWQSCSIRPTFIDDKDRPDIIWSYLFR